MGDKMASFVQRRLKFEFKLNSGTFNNKKDADTVIISDIKASVVIEQPGGYQSNSCSLMLYGLSKELMDRLTVNPWLANNLNRNHVIVSEGNEKDNMTVIFSGDIYSSYADYTNAPNVPFIVQCVIGFVDLLKPTDTIQFKGDVNISIIAKTLADRLGCLLDDFHKIKGTLTDAYYAGTDGQKLKKFAQDADIDIYYTPPLLSICPKGTPRNTSYIPVISSQTGLVDWPMMDSNGFITINILYNPQVFHGCIIDLRTEYPNCKGQFFVLSMFHALESQTPNGQWFTRLILTKTNLSVAGGKVQ